MTVQAQNALLKTIEEPPSYAVILLLTTNQDAFLPTILSRCVQLKLKPLRDSVVKEYLIQSLKVEEAQAEIYAAFAREIWERRFIWQIRRILRLCMRKFFIS